MLNSVTSMLNVRDYICYSEYTNIIIYSKLGLKKFALDGSDYCLFHGDFLEICNDSL